MKKLKVVLSLICAVACLLASGFVPTVNIATEALSYSDNLTEIYPSDFSILDGVYNNVFATDYQKGSSLLNTVFTAAIKNIGVGATNCLFLGSKESGSWDALTFHFTENSLVLGDPCANMSEEQLPGGPIFRESYTFDEQTAGVDFEGETFIFQVSFEVYNTNDLKVGVFFNYTLYNDTYIYMTGAASKLGDCITFRPNVYGAEVQNAGIEISSPKLPNEIYPSDFGIVDGFYNTYFGSDCKKGTSLLNTVFTADIKNMGSGALNCLYYAAPDAGSWGGLVFHFTGSTISLSDPTRNITNNNYTFDEQTAGVKFEGETFRMQISLELLNTSDLKVGVYFNYKLYNGTYLYLTGTNAANKIGNCVIIRPNAQGANVPEAAFEISSPKISNVQNYFEVSPADFGIADGTHNGTSAGVNVGVDGKNLKANLSLKNTGDYIDYRGIRLQTNDTGALLLSDSTGRGNFASETIYTDISDLTVITPSDFGVNYGTYTDTTRVGTYTGATLENTYFTAKMKFTTGDGRVPSFCYGGYDGGAWTGLQINFMPNGISVRDTAIYTEGYFVSANDLGFNYTTDNDWSVGFDFGISTRFGDYDRDGKRDDLQYGIWINGKLVQNKYAYVKDFANTSENTEGQYKFGREFRIYSYSTNSGTGLELTGASSYPPSDTEDFDLDIVTGVVDSDKDGNADDLQVKIFIDETLASTRYITNYDGKLSNTISLKGSVKSPEKQISYRDSVLSFENPSGGAYSKSSGASIKNGKVISGKVIPTGNAAVGLSVAGGASKATFSDFEIDDGVYKSNNKISKQSEVNLEDLYFSAKMKYTNAASFYYGGTAANKGISFTYGATALLIRDANNNLIERVTAQSAGLGTTFNNKEFTLGITAQKSGNNLLLGVWFNETYYKTYTVTGGAASFGKYISLTSNSNSNTVTVTSYLADFPITGNEVVPAEANQPAESFFDVVFATSGSTLNITGDITGSVNFENSFGYDLAVTSAALDDDGEQDDAIVSLYIDGKSVGNRYVFIKNNVNTTPNFNFTSSNAKILKRMPEESIEEKIYSLHQGDFLLMGTGNITINRQDGHRTGEKISTVGEYVIVRDHCGEDYAQKIELWKVGYVNSDNDVNLLDFIAASRYVAGVDSASYIRKGGDLDFDGSLTAKDIVKIKRIILGIDTLPEETLNDKWSFREDVMPISGFFGPTASYIEYNSKEITPNLMTDEVYKAIADCGFNFISYIESYFESLPYTRESNLKNLELASKYGLGALVLRNDYSSTAWTEMQNAVLAGHFAHFPSYEGIVVADEPHGSGYPYNAGGSSMEAFLDRQGYTKYANLYGYSNLLPYGKDLASPKENTDIAADDELYKNYMREFCQKFQPKALCWDYYVLNFHNYTYYYKNLIAGRQVSQEFGIPFWAYLQTHNIYYVQNGEVYPDKVNTKEEMLWNINTMLAFGLKGVQYYYLVQPYWSSPVIDNSHHFDGAGIIAANGQKTMYYDDALAANTQIRAVDQVLMNSDSKEVLAIGSKAREETGLTATSYGALRSATATASRGAVIGCFDYRGKQAFYVASNSFSESQSVTLNFDTTHSLQLISTGIDTTVTANRYTLNLGKGEAVLVVLD